MAEIAAAVRDAVARRQVTGVAGTTSARTLARGNGWSVADVVCSCGPRDRAFEEQHAEFVVAFVVAGSFEHRTHSGSGTLTPGSAMLGNAGECFECGHTHGHGDRCVAFWFAPGYFHQIGADLGLTHDRRFTQHALPPLRDIASIAARAGAGTLAAGTAWEELAVTAAATAITTAQTLRTRSLRQASPRDRARIADTARAMTDDVERPWPLATLSDMAGLSPFHFLRTFRTVIGVTPHQYLRRARLQRAARQLLIADSPVIDVALDSGFGDVSAFTRAFHAEFGRAPRAFRVAHRHHPQRT